jgi:hypothetical protein
MVNKIQINIVESLNVNSMGLIESLNCTQKEVVKFTDSAWQNIKYFKSFYDEHVNKTVDLTGAKTIYISPKCEISREKLKSLLESTGARVVRDPEKADLIFTNAKYCYDTADTQTYKIFDDFDHTNGEQAFMNPDDVKLFRSSFFLREGDTQLKQSLESINKKYKSVRSSWMSASFVDFNFIGTYITIESIEANLILNNLFNNGGINVYDESALLDKMGEAVIDKDTFEAILQMFQSADTSNHTVAMTIMANCNYKKSAVYLAQICRLYGHKVWDHPTRKTVAFKGLISFLGGRMRYQFRFDYEDVFNIAIEQGDVTPEVVDFLYELGADEFSSSTNMIEPNGYKFSEETLTKINNKLNDNGFPSRGEVLQQEVPVQLQQPEQADVCAEHFL